MRRQLSYFRPGWEPTMLARCQVGCDEEIASCGATLTYPIKGMPWRRNAIRSYSFDLEVNLIAELFDEVSRIRRQYPDECLSKSLWNDFSDKANTVTRDSLTGMLCYTLGIYRGDGSTEDYYCLRENSEALLSSKIYQTFSELTSPYEVLI